MVKLERRRESIGDEFRLIIVKKDLLSSPNYVIDYSPASWSASLRLTDSSLETPSEPMVTPYKMAAWCMVARLWVMQMNWVRSERSATILAKRSELASSRAAS